MAESSWPFDDQLSAEDQWREMARQWLSDGVLYGEANLLAVFADSSGMQVKVDTGSAWIRGTFYSSDAVKTLTVAAAHASLTRQDRVVLRLDAAANQVTTEVLTGTPGSGTVPALTQTLSVWEVALATVLVAAATSTLGPSTVTDERRYAHGNDGETPWASYNPGWENWSGGGAGLFNGTQKGQYQRRGLSVDVAVKLTIGSSTVFSAGSPWGFDLPGMIAAVDSGTGGPDRLLTAHAFDVSSGKVYNGIGFIPNGGAAITRIRLAGDDGTVHNVTSTFPFTWAAGDTLSVDGRYPASAAF